MIKLYKRYILTPPAGTISTEGIRLINQWIAQQNTQSETWKKLNPERDSRYLPALPDDWQWTWMGPGGKLTTRIRKWYYETHTIKCPPEFLTELGNIARMHTEDATVYSYEFVNRIDWESGDFGDDNSCYWGSNSEALDILVSNGGLAIRLYDAENIGFGRAWVVPLPQFCIVFNGYGFAQDSTLTIARLLAFHLNTTYRKISLDNNGVSNGTVWINSGIGYAVGPQEVIASITHYDLEWETHDDRCYNCDARLPYEDSIYYGADDMPYCESCYYRLFDGCSHCGETHWQEDINYVDGEYYCNWCFDRYCAPCAECGEPVIKRQATQRKGKYYCREHS